MQEVNRDTPDLQRFVDETAKLVTDVSARDDALAGLVRNLATTTSALTSNGEALGESIGMLPNVLRKANSTFVDLRGSLDDLTPLVDDAKPIVADKVRPLLAQVRPLARDAEPAIQDVSRVVRKRGADNDLIELLNRQPAIDDDREQDRAAQRRRTPRRVAGDDEGARRRDAAGRLPAALRARAHRLVRRLLDQRRLRRARQLLARRPRAQRLHPRPARQPRPGPAGAALALLAAGTKTRRNNRCPGSLERTAPDNSNPYVPSPDFNCDRSQVPIGP